MSDGPETVAATGHPTRMRHADVNGIRLAYDISGSGPPLVLIMGYRLSSRAWPRDFVATLAERFTVIVIDNRGTGESDKPTTGYEIANMARDVCGLLDHLKITRANILGYSMGGAIAQEFVKQFPDRVLALALCATMCGGPRATYASASVVRIMREHEGMTPEQIARRIWTVTYSPGYLERHRELAEDQMRREIAAPTPLHAADLQFQAFAEFDCSRALSGFRVPTLVLTGDQDRLVAPPNSKFIASLIPGARLVVIPDCGHRMMWEATDECVEMVAEFLTGISEGRRDITAGADAQANPPDVMGGFFDLFTPAVDVFATWPLMLAGVGADTMAVARQAVYFGGRAQFGDGKPILLAPQFGSAYEFGLLSNWLKVLGYRPLTVDLSDGKSVGDLVQGVTKRLGRKAVLVAPAAGVRAASTIVAAHKHLISDIVVLNASDHPDVPAGVQAHFITAGWSLTFAMAALPAVLRKIRIQLIEVAGSVTPETINRSAPRMDHQENTHHG